MLKRLVFVCLLGIITILIPQARAEAIRSITADVFRPECLLTWDSLRSDMGKENPGIESFAVQVQWECSGGDPIPVAIYDVEGGSAKIDDAFISGRNFFITLVKWTVMSKAADFGGDIYEVHVYQFLESNARQPFVERKEILGKRANGWDGQLNGKPVYFALKNREAIVKELGRLGY